VLWLQSSILARASDGFGTDLLPILGICSSLLGDISFLTLTLLLLEHVHLIVLLLDSLL
jgi:hypothetical protein